MADHLKKHSEGPSNFCTICNRGNEETLFLFHGMGQHSRGAVRLRDSLQQEEVMPYLCTYSTFPAEYVILKLMEYRSGLFTWQIVPKETQFKSEANFTC